MMIPTFARKNPVRNRINKQVTIEFNVHGKRRNKYIRALKHKMALMNFRRIHDLTFFHACLPYQDMEHVMEELDYLEGIYGGRPWSICKIQMTPTHLLPTERWIP